jgi:Flp pilus assembly pilin Flp
MWYLRDRLYTLRDQRGIETVEWILICSLVLAAAVVIYATLQTGLNTAVSDITSFISNNVP